MRLLSATRGEVTARRHGKGLAYLLLVLPLDVVTALLLLIGMLAGTILLVTPLGAWLLAGLLRAAIRLGGLRRGLVARLLDERVPAPAPLAAGNGAFGWRRAVLADPVGWRAAAYLLVKLPVAVLSLFLGGGCWVYAFVALTFFPLQEHRMGPWWVLVARWIAGLALLLLAPWMLRSVLVVETMLVRGLLGASPSALRMTDLRETRDRVVADADATLRRIERDLHDGAQARLIGVGMQLAIVSELIAAGAPPQSLRAAVDTTQGTLAAAIAELRDLVRGIHPPVLDRGIEAALTTVAAGSGIPTTVTTDLPRRPPPAVESIVYFSACELLTNAARHGGAGAATIEVGLRDDILLLRVRDDGNGGAHPRTGGGLAGLAERVHVVDGRLAIDSPPGGPTTVTVEIPCPAHVEGP